MKVLHVIPSVAPVRGGPSQAILAMTHTLRDQGVEAEIVTTNDNGPDLLDVTLSQCILYEEVPVRFFPRFSPNLGSVREFAFSGALTTWLWRHIADYDLLHVHAIFSYPSTVAMAIARHQHSPYLCRPIGQLCHWSLQQAQRKKQLYLDLIERRNLQRCQSLHFTTHQEQQEAESLHLSTPNFVVPLGLAPPAVLPEARQQLRRRLQLPFDEPIILFLSRLHPKKGLELLISALEQIQSHRFTFVIAGTGDPTYEAEVDQRLESAGLQDRTQRLGFVQGDFKDLLLQGSDLFVLTSYSENFGIAVLEAWAAGLPVLITPGVALALEVQQHQLGWVSEANIDSIATALQRFFADPNDARSMGGRARQRVLQQYTWERVTQQLRQQYQQILQTQAFARNTSKD